MLSLIPAFRERRVGTGGRRLTTVELLTVVRDELLRVPLLFPTLLVPMELATLSSVRMVHAFDATTKCIGKRIDLSDGSRPGSDRSGITLMPGLAIDSPGLLTTPSALDLALFSPFLLLSLYRERGHNAHVSLVHVAHVKIGCEGHDNETELVSQVEKRLGFRPESLRNIGKNCLDVWFGTTRRVSSDCRWLEVMMKALMYRS